MAHSTWTGDAHPHEVSGSFSGNRVDRRKNVKDIDASLDVERSRVHRRRPRGLRSEIDVEVLQGRMFQAEKRVVHGILNVSIWFGAIENFINRRVCVDETGPDFPFLAARHFGSSRGKNLSDLIGRKRW